MLRLKADDEDRRARIGRAVQQVVEDPTRLRHAGRRDDDHRSVLGIQRFRFTGVPRVVDLIEVEQILDRRNEILAMIEDVGMHSEDARRIDGQRAVDVNRNGGDATAARQRVQVVNDFLRAADGKGRDDDASAARCGLANDLAETLPHVLGGRMVAVAIG